ncbi:MAG: hypothetical protein JXP34_02235 [Planctomycetes bacterium]|nr:hypothetical protein [Planctomycetota bacterium]
MRRTAIVCCGIATALAVAAAGCGSSTAASESASRPPVATPAEPPAAPAGRRVEAKEDAISFATAEDLARAVLRALETKDEETLQRVRVTEQVYEEVLWPAFPQAKRPENTIPADFHWMLLDTRSRNGIRDALVENGGRAWDLVAVEPEGIEDYGTYRLWRRVRLRVRPREGGEERTIRPFGSMVERDGRFQVLGYPS